MSPALSPEAAGAGAAAALESAGGPSGAAAAEPLASGAAVSSDLPSFALSSEETASSSPLGEGVPPPQASGRATGTRHERARRQAAMRMVGVFYHEPRANMGAKLAEQ